MIAIYPSELYGEAYDDFRSYPPIRRPKTHRGIAPRHRKREVPIRPRVPLQILIPKNKAIAFGEPRKIPVKRAITQKNKPIKKKIEQKKKETATAKAKALKDEMKQKEVNQKKIARDTPSKTSKILVITLSITTLSLIGYVLWQRQKMKKL